MPRGRADAAGRSSRRGIRSPLGERPQARDDLGDRRRGVAGVDPVAREGERRRSGVSSKSITISAGLPGSARSASACSRCGSRRRARTSRRSRRAARRRHPWCASSGRGARRARRAPCASSHEPPTSGVKPMRVSGIATRERSVTMRMAAWPGEADAAAHGDAVHDRHDGLGVARDHGVEAVLRAEELARLAARCRSSRTRRARGCRRRRRTRARRRRRARPRRPRSRRATTRTRR